MVNTFRVKGKLFGRLTAIKVVPTESKIELWECSCSCGNTHVVSVRSLLSGNTKSCGCYQRERASEANRGKFNKCLIYECYVGVVLTDHKGNEKAIALVDKEDIYLIKHLRWHLGSDGDAIHGSGRNTSYMHRLILAEYLTSDLVVDHINGNKLDNRRRNIRAVTRADNNLNRVTIRSLSGYKGVYRQGNGSWMAQLTYKKKKYYLGTFSDPKLAAKAYNAKANELSGGFIKLNDV